MKRKALGSRNRVSKKLKSDWCLPPDLEHESELIKKLIDVADKYWHCIIEDVWESVPHRELQYFCFEISQYIPDAAKIREQILPH